MTRIVVNEERKAILCRALLKANERKAILCRALLKANKPMSAQDLSAFISVNCHNVWHIANVMESDGLITRENVAEGEARKRSYFSLTAYGAEVANGLIAEPSNEVREFSIKDLCNGADYRQWLKQMKAIARGLN